VAAREAVFSIGLSWFLEIRRHWSSGYTHEKRSSRRRTNVRRTRRSAGRRRRCAAAVTYLRQRPSRAASGRTAALVRTTDVVGHRWRGRGVDDGRLRRQRRQRRHQRQSRTTWRKTFWATAAVGRLLRIRSCRGGGGGTYLIMSVVCARTWGLVGTGHLCRRRHAPYRRRRRAAAEGVSRAFIFIVIIGVFKGWDRVIRSAEAPEKGVFIVSAHALSRSLPAIEMPCTPPSS